MTSVLFDEIFEMPVQDRIGLARDILDSVVSDAESVEVSVEQMVELERRIEDYHKNPGGGRSWEEIRDAALAR